jgi:simple sugar transport system substrate-binding protein
VDPHWRAGASTVLTLTLGLSLAACSSGHTDTVAVKSPAKAARITVAMVTHGQSFDPFWSLVQEGSKQAASDFNVDLQYQSPPTTDPAAEASLITQAAAKKPAGMVVTIPDSGVLSPAIQQATAAGIPVVVANVGANEYQKVGALTFVGQDDTAAGEEAGSRMSAAGVKQALCVIHEQQNSALTDRCDGFRKQMSSAGGTVKVLNVNGAQLHDAQSAIENALKADPSITGVLATGIIGFSAAGGALKSMNAFGKIKLGSFDVSSTNLAAVQNDQALFIIDQQPFLEGYDAVQVASFQVRYGQHPYKPIFTGPSVITKDNASKVLNLYQGSNVSLAPGGYPQ